MNQPVPDVLDRLWAVEHALESLSRAMLATHGVTGAQQFALRVLDARPGLTPGDLARALRVDPSTLTAMLHRLEQRGLVTREPDPADHRRVRLRPTPAGADLAAHTGSAVEAALDRTLDAIDAQALDHILGWLDHLAVELDSERRALIAGGA